MKLKSFFVSSFCLLFCVLNACENISDTTLLQQYEVGALQWQMVRKEIDPNTLIHRAIFENSPEVLEFLLKHYVDVDYPDQNGMSPLTIAILSQQPKIVKLLLENGAQVTPVKKWNGMSLLEISMKAKDTESMRYLIEFNADVNAEFKDCDSQIQIAVKDFILSTKWDLLKTLVNSNRLSPMLLDQALVQVGHHLGQPSDNMLRELIQKGANVNVADGLVLWHSCANQPVDASSIARIEMLLENGANPNLRSQGSVTPFILMADNLHIMKLMLKAGANPNGVVHVSNKNEKSPLMMAIMKGTQDSALERVKLLVEAGADVNKKMMGMTAVEYAFTSGRMDIVKYLMQKTSDI